MRPTIVYVHPHLTMRTGATAFVLTTAAALRARGYPVVIIVAQADPSIVGGYDGEIVELGGALPSDPRHWVGLPALQRRMTAVLDRIPNKILFPQVHPANYWAFTYKAMRPWVPCVWMCQEPSAFVHSWSNIRSLQGPMRLATIAANPSLQIIDRLLVKQADSILANSHFTAASVQRIYGRHVDAVAYPPLDDDAFSIPHIPRDCILSLGRLTRFKRVDLALQGYALAYRDKGNDLPPLVIAGNGPELPRLRAQALALGVEKRVCFTGQVTDTEKRALYARALFLVGTAPAEPFGLVGPEAMAASTPVLAPDHGGLAETVIDGQTGALYRAGDAADLATKLTMLLARPSQLEQMRARARQHALKQYTAKNATLQIERAMILAAASATNRCR